MALEKIAEKNWLYTLYRLDNGSIVLSVLCGGVGMYELNIPLGNEVAARAIEDEELLEKIASEIREHPQQYSGQSIVL